jgi:hypothetical protein
MTSTVVEIDHSEGYKLLDKAARSKLGMTGEEFLQAYDRGDLDRSELAVLEVEILIPFAR